MSEENNLKRIMMMDFKYHTVWHVLITDSQKRTFFSQTHNSASDPQRGTAPIFAVTAYLAHVECHGSRVLTNLHDKVSLFLWNVICFYKKKKKSNNTVMDKLIWLFLKCILRKTLHLEIEEINQHCFPAYLSTYPPT